MPSTISLENYSYCRFLTNIDNSWNHDHFRAQGIVRAIKGESFNGYRTLQVNGGWQTLTEDNPELAYAWFAEQVATQPKFGSNAPYFLCPMPDSGCTVGSQRSSNTMGLVDALSSRLPILQRWDGLRFLREMPKSRGGMRVDEETLFNAMTLIAPPPEKGLIIILDDVCTIGSHARAAGRRLLASGAKELCAMSVARTLLDRTEDVFGLKVDSLGEITG